MVIKKKSKEKKRRHKFKNKNANKLINRRQSVLLFREKVKNPFQINERIVSVDVAMRIRVEEYSNLRNIGIEQVNRVEEDVLGCRCLAIECKHARLAHTWRRYICASGGQADVFDYVGLGGAKDERIPERYGKNRGEHLHDLGYVADGGGVLAVIVGRRVDRVGRRRRPHANTRVEYFEFL